MRRAFTLVELMVVIGMITALAAIAVPSYAMIRNTLSLNTATDEFVSTLRSAQAKAVASQNNHDWKVELTADWYSICESVGTPCPVNTHIPLPSNFTITPPPTTWSWTFARLYGTTGTNSPVTLTYSGRSKTIKVEASGFVTRS